MEPSSADLALRSSISCRKKGMSARIKKLGIPDHYIEQGTIAELQHECGYDKEGIIAALKEMLDPAIAAKIKLPLKLFPEFN